MFSHNNLNLALFEIKLASPHKNLILLKGNQNEVENVPFEGNVKLSIPNDVHVRKIKLNLIGEFNVQYFRRTTSGLIIDQIVDRFCILKVEWNNLLTSPDGIIQFGNYGDDVMQYSKIATLKSSSTTQTSSSSKPSADRPVFLRTSSHPILSAHGVPSTGTASPAGSITSSNNSSTTSLLKLRKSGIDGTPFENLNPNPSHSFLLPKGNYNLPFKVYLPTNICETIEGISCGKVQYKMLCTISRGKFEKPITTSKYIRILRTLHPLNLNLIDSIDIANVWPKKLQYNVSLAKKGVAIGSTIPISVIIVPLVKGLGLKSISACIVQHFHVSHDTNKSPEYELLLGKQDLKIPSHNELGEDKWTIKTFYKVPNNLSSLTQTCELKNNFVTVKHRIRISIQLKNKEGHVSELRANLPINVYVSAYSGHVIANHFTIDQENQDVFEEDKHSQDILFKKDRSLPNTPNLSDVEDSTVDNDLDREDEAPPLYQAHVYDRVYDMNLPQTPLEQFRSQDNTPLHSANTSMTQLSSYFDDAFGLQSQTLPKTPPIPLDVEKLCKIPTYDQAVDADDDVAGDLSTPAPNYSDEESDEESSLSSDSIPRPKMTKWKSMDRNQFRLGSRTNGIHSLPHSPLSRSPIRGLIDESSESIDERDIRAKSPTPSFSSLPQFHLRFSKKRS
ncbi:uncharacterized protein RJT21DRAFT_89143 [Scheffersomyces amazonensis]|uniref:uncharacterized protein n=1 Tax=Scheffersomyces amazonensis TaxID=1078765 RepID=UPI00315D5AE1